MYTFWWNKHETILHMSLKMMQPKWTSKVINMKLYVLVKDTSLQLSTPFSIPRFGISLIFLVSNRFEPLPPYVLLRSYFLLHARHDFFFLKLLVSSLPLLLYLCHIIITLQLQRGDGLKKYCNCFVLHDRVVEFHECRVSNRTYCSIFDDVVGCLWNRQPNVSMW